MEILSNYTIFDQLTEEEQEKIVRDFLEYKYTIRYNEEHHSMVLVGRVG